MAATCARFIAIQRQNTPRRHIPTPREIHQSLDKSRFIFRLSVYDYVGLKEYIASLFDGRVDVVSRDGLKPYVRPAATADAVYAF